MLGAVPAAALYFAVYEMTHARLLRRLTSRIMREEEEAEQEDDKQQQRRGSGSSSKAPPAAAMRRHERQRHAAAVAHVAAAAAGAAASAVVRVPADVLKHRVQAWLFPDVLSAARAAIAGERGPAGLYAGFGPTLVRDIPEAAISFALYGQLRRWGEETGVFGRLGLGGGGGGGAKAAGSGRGHTAAATAVSPLEHMVLGGAAGAFAAAVTTPLDVVKTMVQCSTPDHRAGALGTLARILQARGPGALFAGGVPRVAQAAVTSALFFAALERIRPWCVAVVPPPERILEMRLAAALDEAERDAAQASELLAAEAALVGGHGGAAATLVISALD
jgi:solute carrier family 25 S-adenosylmethionine transporter 26